METKHTPGPWHVEHDTTGETLRINGEQQAIPNYAGNDKFTPAIAIALDGSSEFNPLTLLANARLIAAAPELLAALQKIHENVTEGWIRKYTSEAIEAATGMKLAR